MGQLDSTLMDHGEVGILSFNEVLNRKSGLEPSGSGVIRLTSLSLVLSVASDS